MKLHFLNNCTRHHGNSESWLPRQSGLSENRREPHSLSIMVVCFSPLISTFSLHGSCVWAIGFFASLKMVPFNEICMKWIRCVTREATAWPLLGLLRRELHVPN